MAAMIEVTAPGRRPLGRPRTIVPERRGAALEKPLFPQGHRAPAHTELLGSGRLRQSAREQQHDAAAPDETLLRGRRADPMLQQCRGLLV